MKDKEFELAVWVLAQKNAYQNGELTKEQIAKMEELPGFSWELTADERKLLLLSNKLKSKKLRDNLNNN